MKNFRNILLSSALLTTSLLSAQNVDSRPNIILFLVDDMGWEDTSLPFYKEVTKYNEVYETPNMERLASQGMMFTQAYASSISSPSRCSLISGSNAARHHVTNWTLKRNESTDNVAVETQLEFPQWNVNGLAVIPGVERTYQITPLPELLRRAGYHTIHCGKAHFGAIDTPGENPVHFGFEVNIAGHAAGGLASYLGEQNFGHDADGNPVSPMAIPGLEQYWGKDIFATEALTQEAIKALDKAGKYGQPFFLYMAHYAIHVPVDKDMRFYDKYIAKGLSEKEAAYAALIEGMDKSLGDIMDWLERTGNDKNTIIMFMSDNGGLAAEPWWRDGEPHTQNYPLRSGKGSAYEGGIREPMIVKWPGVVREGSKCDDYMVIEDYFPTILEMAGIRDYTTVQHVDGISFVPMLTETGDTSRDRCLYWNFPNRWGNDGPGIDATCTIREGDYKLIYYYRNGKKELFNIPADISESHDLASEMPEKVKELSVKLGKFMRESGAQRPVFRETGKPCPWPDEI